MCPDDDTQQPNDSASAEAAPAPAAEVPAQPTVDPTAALFNTPQLDVSLRESEHES